jgi:hypothetical protein
VVGVGSGHISDGSVGVAQSVDSLVLAFFFMHYISSVWLSSFFLIFFLILVTAPERGKSPQSM